MPFPTPTATRPPTQTPEARLLVTPATLSPIPNPDQELQPTPNRDAPGDLLPFPADHTPEIQIELPDWKPASYSSSGDTLPVDLESLSNFNVLDGLTSAQRKLLSQNGFVAIQSQEDQFADLRLRVSRNFGQSYYLTTDAAYHAFHLTFTAMLKALEKEELRPRMIELTQAVLDEVLVSWDQAPGTAIESDLRLAAAYLSVALKLFDPQARIDPRIEADVSAQLAQIKSGTGRDRSVLLPSFEDDYSAYQPIGYYAGDPELETYFQGMTWFGRFHFRLNPSQSDATPSRAPLIITLALRRAKSGENPASESWALIHDTLSFLVGETDDAGPREYAGLMDKVYGRGSTIIDLADDERWNVFQSSQEEIPAPRINSTFANSLDHLANERGWRFMGQRFTLDAFVLQNLVYDRVGTPEKKRSLPSGLDVMAALNSQAALEALEAAGETSYQNYTQQLTRLQNSVLSETESGWLSGAYRTWLYSFLPLLASKAEAYPPGMRTSAWAYKDLNSALGSWAELKHDTALYSKMPEFAGGGGPPGSGPAPGYVEPNPQVFYRLSYAAQKIALVLTENHLVGEPGLGPAGLDYLLPGMDSLGRQFQQLGNIAVKELAGQPLTVDDYEIIQAPLGPVESNTLYMQEMARQGVGPGDELPPVAVTASVAGADDDLLQVAIGKVDRIYVVVPIEGKLQAAQGGIFSYFEFAQPRERRLTDRDWRMRLSTDPPPRPAWVGQFSLPGGAPVDRLALRVGDIYLINRAGDNLNVRDEPDRQAQVRGKLIVGDYFEIIAGPQNANGQSWWKIRAFVGNPQLEGWIVENLDWYERAWGQ